MGYLDYIYGKLPVVGQHLAVSIYGFYWKSLRFGPGFDGYLREYEERERFTGEQWKNWQAHQLKHILNLCNEHVPYYRNKWTQPQKDEARKGNLQGLPLLEKHSVRAASRAFLRDDFSTSHTLKFATSGSTGTPIECYYKVNELRDSLALREARSARWAGVSFRMPRATFSGRMVEPDPNSNGPYYRFNAAERQVYFSPFHLRADTAKLYVRALEKHKIQWMTGYAVSFYLLSKFMLAEGIPAPERIRSVITTSEKLTSDMRAVISRAFDCRVFEEYSSVENIVFASECEHGSLHVSPDNSIVEILRPDGSPCEPGEIGEVVATSLRRTYQPLIRYKLGDLAMWDPQKCHCGREMPVLKEVIGRIEDVVTGPDGRKMVRFHGIFTNQPHVREGQIIQEATTQIRVKVVPTSDFSPNDEFEIIERVQQRLGKAVTVIVEQVDTIPRLKSGKFQAVISHLDQGN